MFLEVNDTYTLTFILNIINHLLREKENFEQMKEN